METITLNGRWAVRPASLDCIGEAGLKVVDAAQDGWIEAQVPGEIHLDLMRAGQMLDPSVSNNMPACRWPESHSWWYRTRFEVGAEFQRHERQQLIFEGLDLYAQVFVNGKSAGEARNAFVPAVFDVKQLLRAGQNELLVRLTAGNELVPSAKCNPPRAASEFDGTIKGDLAFPDAWTLFGPVAEDALEPAFDALRSIPTALEIGGERLAGRETRLQNNQIDLGALLGGVKVRKTAYLMAEIALEQDAEVTFGASMDWWMKWWVNGQVVCDTTNYGNSAHPFKLGDHCFSVKLRKGRNIVAVKCMSGSGGFLLLAGGPRELRQFVADGGNVMGNIHAHRLWPGRRWLRKPQFCYGWDWVDALPNIGIWRGVRLEGRTLAVLHDLRLDTVRQGKTVCLEMEAIVENLHPLSERPCALHLEIRAPNNGPVICRKYDLHVPPGRIPVRDVIRVDDPQLWWPNGMGAQPLYHVAARVIDASGAVCDGRDFSIGLRTIEIDRSRMAEGSRFCFVVNGQDVFCRGGNIGPHDAILARITDAKYEALVAEARNANLNMIRINGCSIYEAPAFYDACDRAGILVWHDFMLTCDTIYPDYDKDFCAAIRDEAEAIVPALRHHPSIALWCGNNEIQWMAAMAKVSLKDFRGHKFYGQLLPDLCRCLDPHRPYWPSSPCGGEDPNSEIEGDCHWWHPFFMNPDINRRIRHEVFDECKARFVSEYGAIGPCHLDSIREYLKPEEMKPGSLAWQVHTNMFDKETVPAAIRRHYADPEGLTIPESVLYGQMFQAIAHGYAMEALRFRKHDPKDDCQGALIWSYSDCWGETGWSILDYYLRRKASYYWVRRASAPLKVIVRRRENRLLTRIVNDTLQSFHGTVESGWWRLDGADRDIKTQTVKVSANSMAKVASATIPSPRKRNPSQWVYAAVLRREDGLAMDQSVWTLLPCRELALATPAISVCTLADGLIDVSSPVFCHAVHAEDHGRELISDNWFDLLPNVPVRVQVAEGHRTDPIEFNAVLPKQGKPHA